MKKTRFHIYIERTTGAPIEIGDLTKDDVEEWTNSWYAASTWLSLLVTPEEAMS